MRERMRRMFVGLLPLLAMSALMAGRPPVAEAQGVTVTPEIAWLKNVDTYTWATSVDGQTVGGPFYPVANVRFKMYVPEGTNVVSAQVNTVTIREVPATHYPAKDLLNGVPIQFGTGARPELGEPMPSDGYYPWRYTQTQLSLGEYHNSPHEIAYTGQYTTLVNYRPTTTQFSGTFMPVIKDPVFTSVAQGDPWLFHWTTAGQGYTVLLANWDAIHEQTAQLKMQIFDAAGALQRTMYQDVNTKDLTATFVWNGVKDDGTLATPGAFMNLVEMGRFTGSPSMNYHDQSKSEYITITDMALVSATYVPGSNGAYKYKFRYNFTSDSNRSALQGRISVYRPDGVLDGEYSLVDVTQRTPGEHYVEWERGALDMPGNWHFVLSLLDDHADKDRGHRNRWALQKGARVDASVAPVPNPAALPTPSNLAASASGRNVTLTWTAATDRTIHLLIERAPAGTTAFQLIGAQWGYIPTYPDTAPAAGSYIYRTRYYKTSPESFGPYSSTVTVTVQ